VVKFWVQIQRDSRGPCKRNTRGM